MTRSGAYRGIVLRDEVYGSDRRLRLRLEEQQHPYVLAVAVKEPIWIGFEQYRVDAVTATLAPTNWVRLSCGDGTKGPREYDWATVAFNCPTALSGVAGFYHYKRRLVSPILNLQL